MNVFEEYKVENDGIFIPKKELERLFNYYYIPELRHQLSVQMYIDFFQTYGKTCIIENLLQLIQEKE